MERCQAGAVVLQSADIRLIGERAILGRLDRVVYGHIHPFVHTGDDVGAVALCAHAAVGVYPDAINLAAAGFGRLQRTKAS